MGLRFMNSWAFLRLIVTGRIPLLAICLVPTKHVTAARQDMPPVSLPDVVARSLIGVRDFLQGRALIMMAVLRRATKWLVRVSESTLPSSHIASGEALLPATCVATNVMLKVAHSRSGVATTGCTVASGIAKMVAQFAVESSDMKLQALESPATPPSAQPPGTLMFLRLNNKCSSAIKADSCAGKVSQKNHPAVTLPACSPPWHRNIAHSNQRD